MIVKPCVEAIALHAQVLYNEKLHQRSSSLVKQYRHQKLFQFTSKGNAGPSGNISEHTVQLILLNVEFGTHAFPSWPSIIGKYSYTRPGNIMTRLWNIGRELPRRMNHSLFILQHVDSRVKVCRHLDELLLFTQQVIHGPFMAILIVGERSRWRLWGLWLK